MEPSSKKEKPKQVLQWGPESFNKSTPLNEVNEPQSGDEIKETTLITKKPVLPVKKATPKIIPRTESTKKERATYYLGVEYITLVARAAYWDREDSQADVIEKALDMYFAGKTYEPTPKEGKK